MTTSFEVDYVVLCEYSSISNTNKVLLAGIFGGEINFQSAPTHWTQMSMVASIIPRVRDYQFRLSFVSPNGKQILSVDGHYNVDRDPDEIERTIFNIQIPPAPFGGPGQYRIEVHERDDLVFTRSIQVNVGASPIRTTPNIHLEIKAPKQ